LFRTDSLGLISYLWTVIVLSAVIIYCILHFLSSYQCFLVTGFSSCRQAFLTNKSNWIVHYHYQQLRYLSCGEYCLHD